MKNKDAFNLKGNIIKDQDIIMDFFNGKNGLKWACKIMPVSF